MCLSCHTLCVWSLALSSELFPPPHTACGWDAVAFESVCLLSRARHWRRTPAGTTHLVRPCFQGLQADVCTLSLVSCSVALAGEFVWLARPFPSRLFRVARLRLLTPAVPSFTDQVPRGQRVPLDQFRTLLIDRSAESMESFLPSRSRIWRRLASTSRQLTLLTHLETHLEALFVVTHCEPVSYFTLSFVSLRRYSLSTHLDLHVEAVMPCWHFRRRLALPTHLELRVEALAAVAPSSLTQAVVCSIRCLCVSFVTLFTLLCWAAC